jgi:hypothetical protein
VPGCGTLAVCSFSEPRKLLLLGLDFALFAGALQSKKDALLVLLYHVQANQKIHDYAGNQDQY